MKVLDEDEETFLNKLEEELSVSVGKSGGEMAPQKGSIFKERETNFRPVRSEKISASEAKQRLSSLAIAKPIGEDAAAESSWKQSEFEWQPLDQIEKFVLSGPKSRAEISQDDSWAVEDVDELLNATKTTQEHKSAGIESNEKVEQELLTDVNVYDLPSNDQQQDRTRTDDLFVPSFERKRYVLNTTGRKDILDFSDEDEPKELPKIVPPKCAALEKTKMISHVPFASELSIRNRDQLSHHSKLLGKQLVEPNEIKRRLSSLAQTDSSRSHLNFTLLGREEKQDDHGKRDILANNAVRSPKGFGVPIMRRADHSVLQASARNVMANLPAATDKENTPASSGQDNVRQAGGGRDGQRRQTERLGGEDGQLRSTTLEMKEGKRLVPHPPPAPRADRNAARAPGHVRGPTMDRTGVAMDVMNDEKERMVKEQSPSGNEQQEQPDRASAPVLRPTPPARGRQGQAAVRLAINRKVERMQLGDEREEEGTGGEEKNEADELMSRRKRNILLKWWRQEARALAQVTASNERERRERREAENLKTADEMLDRVKQTLLQINDRLFDMAIIQTAGRLLEEADAFIRQNKLTARLEAAASLRARVQQAEQEVHIFRKGERALRVAEEALRARRWREVEEESAIAKEAFEMTGALDKVFVVSQLLHRAGAAKKRREQEERAEALLQEGELALSRGDVKEAKEKAEEAKKELEKMEGGMERVEKLFGAIARLEEERRVKGFREEGRQALQDAREYLQEGNFEDTRIALRKSRRLLEEGRCVQEFSEELMRLEEEVAQRMERKDWRGRAAACLQEAEKRMEQALRGELQERTRLLEQSFELTIKCKVMMEHVEDEEMRAKLKRLTRAIESAAGRTEKALQLESDLKEAEEHVKRRNFEIASNFLLRAEQVARDAGLDHRKEEMEELRRRIEEERGKAAKQQVVLSRMKGIEEILNDLEKEERRRASEARAGLDSLAAEIASGDIELSEEMEKELEKLRHRVKQSEDVAEKVKGAEEELELAREFLSREELKLARKHVRASEDAFEEANNRSGRARAQEVNQEIEKMERKVEMRRRLQEARELLTEEEFEQAKEKVRDARRMREKYFGEEEKEEEEELMNMIRESEERAKMIARASELVESCEEAMGSRRLEDARRLAEEARSLFRAAKLTDALEEVEDMMEKIAKMRGEAEAKGRSRELLAESEEEVKQLHFHKARELAEAAKRMARGEDVELQEAAVKLLARIGEEEERHEMRGRGEEAMEKIDTFLQQEATKEARKALQEAKSSFSVAACLPNFGPLLELAEIRIRQVEEKQEKKIRLHAMVEEVEEAASCENWEEANRQLQDASSCCRAAGLQEEFGEKLEMLGRMVSEGREEKTRVEGARRAIRACEEALEGLNVEASRIFLGHAKEAAAACRSQGVKEEVEALERRVTSREAAHLLLGRAEEAMSSVRANLELMRVVGKRRKVVDARESLESAKKLLLCSGEDHSAMLARLEREVEEGERWALLCDEGEELLEEGRRLQEQGMVEAAAGRTEEALKKFEEAGEERSTRMARELLTEIERRRSGARGKELMDAIREKMEEMEYLQVCELCKLAQVEFLRAGMGGELVVVEGLLREATSRQARQENAQRGERCLLEAKAAVSRREMKVAKSLLVDVKTLLRLAEEGGRAEEVSEVEREIEALESCEKANEELKAAVRDAGRLIAEKDFRYARIVLSKAKDVAVRAGWIYEGCRAELESCEEFLREEEKRWERRQEGEKKLKEAESAYKHGELEMALKLVEEAEELYAGVDEEEARNAVDVLRTRIQERSEALLSEGKLEDAAELAREALAKMRGEDKPDLKGKAERVIETVELRLKQSSWKEVYLNAIRKGKKALEDGDVEEADRASAGASTALHASGQSDSLELKELEEMIKRKKMSQQARQLIAQMEHLIANNNLEEARSLLVRTVEHLRESDIKEKDQIIFDLMNNIHRAEQADKVNKQIARLIEETEQCFNEQRIVEIFWTHCNLGRNASWTDDVRWKIEEVEKVIEQVKGTGCEDEEKYLRHKKRTSEVIEKCNELELRKRKRAEGITLLSDVQSAIKAEDDNTASGKLLRARSIFTDLEDGEMIVMVDKMEEQIGELKRRMRVKDYIDAADASLRDAARAIAEQCLVPFFLL
ncbi:hypothetical protein GUITHDRAFT_139040 [Guillardia theta CCMP2712]|uniref:Uncharacterized protein n=1 Tax=Guillardia theta (strain CCMP2712) TaxID=905079 RepID=L1JAC9_GUITC|nr:hypothetical protein GUITHDRAFT_139040 [Guillardia theta CCMP2712]EKX45481.1 hypothetical protein GUITHDRAFT_139040 [Guillardia theta CCMP2712]|eukprot:XP_005832461.1 hypothetical protein GUITHDRAFT_139040 [Guillardia theta CCMP2712]